MTSTTQSTADKSPNALEHRNAAGAMDVDSSTNGISMDEALAALGNEISGLMIKIATAGNKPRSVIDPWKDLLKAKRSDFQELTEMSALLSSGGSSAVSSGSHSSLAGVVSATNIVPNGLPLFQWPGFVRDDKREIFADIEECLRRFEDVLNSHSLDCDYNWYRLLPRCLGQDSRDWLNEFVKADGNDVPWHTLKGAITVRYGVPKEQLRFGRIREFLACTKAEQESIDTFLERFKRLRAKSGISDKYVIAMVFFDAFPEDTARLIMVSMGHANESCFYDIEYVSAAARRVDIAKRDKFGHDASSAGAT